MKHICSLLISPGLRVLLYLCRAWGSFESIVSFTIHSSFSNSIPTTCCLVYTAALNTYSFSVVVVLTVQSFEYIHMAHSGIGLLKCHRSPSFSTPKSYSSAWSHIPGDRHLRRGTSVGKNTTFSQYLHTTLNWNELVLIFVSFRWNC